MLKQTVQYLTKRKDILQKEILQSYEFKSRNKFFYFCLINVKITNNNQLHIKQIV